MARAAGWGRICRPPVRRGAEAGFNDIRIPATCIPPPPGARDRRAARWSVAMAIMWSVYLLAVFGLPERVAYRPTMATLDVLLWPLVRGLGKPGTVALLAAGVALLTLAVQKLATDNGRLREARRRAARLHRMAAALPADAPGRAALRRLAAPVRLRSVSGGAGAAGPAAGTAPATVGVAQAARGSGRLERRRRLAGPHCGHGRRPMERAASPGRAAAGGD